MAGKAETVISGTHAEEASSGVVKFLRDVGSVLEMKVLYLVRGWYWFAIRPIVFPLGVLFWLRVMLPDDPVVNLRILSGALVFGVSLSTANLFTQLVLQDRFLGRVKLLVTMPMSKASYAVGVLVFAAIQSSPVVVVLLVFSFVVGVDVKLTSAFFPLIVAALLSVAGIALMIASYAPSVEAGGIMSNLFGVVLVMVSPVFFTMDQAPFVLQVIGWVSPMRYAADGITKAISGNGQIWLELGVLMGFAVASMALGLWKMQWREK